MSNLFSDPPVPSAPTPADDTARLALDPVFSSPSAVASEFDDHERPERHERPRSGSNGPRRPRTRR
ncbi:hypothetical protein [Nakamurella leprariae]|uniref:Uncharacterized protein n=1 Tax=Nakamurella leprariae TaxID=2803911 RepID=A0A938YBG2_9ACTN|nr:hypothetical protein [Nakamurella leprariae]MBM9469410.1 hypothetical protein [Nakamurella leprariae]